ETGEVSMSANFQLVSPFQPAGDQPQAIEKLVTGFQAGQNRQTLLGATGTGKSVAWDEPVLTRWADAAGRAHLAVAPIGELIDAAFKRPGVPGASEVTIPPQRIEVLSFNGDSCSTEWRP